MDGFKKLPKMQHFKEGGSVQRQIANYEKRERKVEEKADINQDKAIVKKAIKMHDVQEHGGEKTNLSKLNKGGRAKKEVGTVSKYKAGGLSDQKFLASGDKDATKRVKDTSKIAATPSKGTVKAKSTPKAFCGGKSVKKYADGRIVKDPQKLVDDIATKENTEDRELVMKPLRAIKDLAVKGYNKLTGQGSVTDAERAIAQKMGALQGQGAVSDAERETLGRAMAPSAPVNQSSGTFNKKCGGKVAKK